MPSGRHVGGSQELARPLGLVELGERAEPITSVSLRLRPCRRGFRIVAAGGMGSAPAAGTLARGLAVPAHRPSGNAGSSPQSEQSRGAENVRASDTSGEKV